MLINCCLSPVYNMITPILQCSLSTTASQLTEQGFIQDFQLGGDNVPVINKSHLGGSGGMLPQKLFEF